MTTELDKIAKKQATQDIDKGQKKLNIKQHNIKAAIKADKADPEKPGLFGSKRYFKLKKELKKTEKTEKWLDKQQKKVDQGKGGVVGLVKKDIIEKGFPSKANLQSGGRATHGYGRAFMKGGRA